MKSKQINKIISAILVSEFIYALVKVIPKFLVYFDPTRLILWIIAFSIFALLLISAIGVFLNKKWGVVILWVFILLPILVRTTTFFILPVLSGYGFQILNVSIATYLTILYWGKRVINN